MSSITTSVLVIDPQAIEWDKVERSGHFVAYEIPYAEKRKWDYLQNWYLGQSRYPYYMNTGARMLYVKYPQAEAAPPLTYNEQTWQPKEMRIKAKDQFHALVKLLVSDYFNRREMLVSNNDFYLPVYATRQEHLKVLDIGIQERRTNGDLSEFVISDHARTILKAQDVKPGEMHQAYYFMDSKDGFAVVRRLNPHGITKRHIEQGVYFFPPKVQFRTRMSHLHAGSEEQLKRCRVYPLWYFIDGLLAYLNEVGLPFTLRQSPYWQVSDLSPQKSLRPRIDMRGMTVSVVDDRLRPAVQPALEPVDFLSKLTNRMQELVTAQGWTPTLVPTTKTKLKAGDLVLRLQDNISKDFFNPPDVQADEKEQKVKPTSGLLRAYSDPYKTFQLEHADTISQSLSVNTKTSDDEDDEGDEETEGQDEDAPQTEQDYMSYKLPTKTQLEVRLLNSLYQLYLKYVITHPDNAVARFPVLKLMRDNIFLYADSLVYLQDGSLRFMPTTNNPAAEILIQELTGWNLLDDVLGPAMDYQYRYNTRFSEEEKRGFILKNSRFTISHDYVWQIETSPERVLPNVPEIRQRLWTIEEVRSKEDFMPTYSEAELAVFDVDKLRAFEDFLRHDVPEPISFKNLTSKKYRGFYSLLGITTSTKFKRYLEAKGLAFKSPKGGDVIPAYIGISYIPETQQYHVGDIGSMDESYRQAKGFTLRRVEVHRSKSNLPLFEQLTTNLFPLLAVEFVRYKRYTVYPFPFNLIEVWRKTVLKDGESDELEQN